MKIIRERGRPARKQRPGWSRSRAAISAYVVTTPGRGAVSRNAESRRSPAFYHRIPA